MKDNIVIRLAEASDIEKVANLYVTNWKSVYRGLLSQKYLDGINVKDTVKKWSEYIENERHGIFVAYSGDGEFLGFAAFKPYHRIDDCIYIDSLHVAEEHRGRGVGSELVECVRGRGISEGYPLMGVCVVKGNDRARDLYIRLGACHYMNKVDDYTGEVSYSEILVWNL